MGYDFEALEDGEVTITLYRHDESGRSQSRSFTVEKGKKYSYEFGGVEIRDR